MSYTPTQWKIGDKVTTAKLNKLEQGVAEGSGGYLLVHVDQNTGTCDQTFGTIKEALTSGKMIWFMIGEWVCPINEISITNRVIHTYEIELTASSDDDYPSSVGIK